jgi:hypothetical protein
VAQRRFLFGAAAALALYALLTLVLTYPLVNNLDRAIPGDSFDGWQNYWNFWWLKQSLVDQLRNPLWTDQLYAPTGVSLLFHTLNPFNGLVTLPVQLAGNLYLAYNASVLLAFAAGGLGTYLLVYQVLASSRRSVPWAAPFIAGLIFTFSPYHLAHLLGHMQLISLQWIPFYALYLWRGLQRARGGQYAWHDSVLAGLFLVLVALCDWYYLFYCLLLTVLAVAWVMGRQLWRAWRSRERAAISSLWPVLVIPGLSFIVLALVLSPILVPMVREARAFSFMVPPASESMRLSADLLAFVTPAGFHPWWGEAVRAWADRSYSSSFSEYTVFVGFVALGLAVLGAWRGGRGRGFWLTATLAFFVLALGPVLHVAGQTDLLPGGGQLRLPYAWLYNALSLMRIARSVSRFAVMVMLGLAVLAGMGLAWLLSRLTSRPRLRAVTPWLVAGAILFEFLPVPYPVSQPDTPAWYTALSQAPGTGAVLNLPMNWDRPGYLLYQTVHERPLTVGYISRDDPRTLTTRAPVLQQLRALGPDVLTDDLSRVGPSVLAWLGVEYVVLDNYKMPGPGEREPTTAIAHAVFGDQAPVFTDERLTVYRLEPPAAPQPFLVLGSGWGPRQVIDQQVARAVQPEADLHIIHARPSTLAITARGPAGTLLRVRDEAGRELGQLALQPAWTTYAIRLPDPVPGARLELEHDAALNQVLVSALSLTADE